MPMIVAPDRWQDWLDPRVPAEQAAGLMVPPAPGELEVNAVLRAVNNVRDSGPELVEPIPESDTID